MSTASSAVETQLSLIPNFPKWCKRTEVSLKLERDELSFKEWAAVFDTLRKNGKSHQWQIGDHLNLGESWFGEDYTQVIDPNEELEREEDSGETYRQYQQVSCRIEIGRRLPKISWSHHQAIAYLERSIQDYWLERLATERISLRALRKALREAKAMEVEHVSDLAVLQDPEVRAWLEADIQRQRDEEPNIPVQASFLRNMMHARIGQAQWQLDRTVEGDCLIVREAVKELLGSADQIFMWLQNRNYFMSPPDLDDRLDLLVGQGRIKETQEEGRKKGQKGGMKTVYLPIRNPMDVDEDFDEEAD